MIRILVFLGILTLWPIVISIFNISDKYFPSLINVFENMFSMLSNQRIYVHFLVTFTEALTGFLIGSIAGIIIGIFISEIGWVRKYFYSYVLAGQAIPIIALAPLFIIWFGFGMSSKIVMAVAIVLFPIIVNTISGLSNVDQSLIKLLKAYGANRWQIFIHVKLRSSLSYIFASLDIAIVLSISGAVVSEFVGASQGLGYLIMTYNSQMNIAAEFVVLFLLGGLGISLSYVLKIIRQKVVFWE